MTTKQLITLVHITTVPQSLYFFQGQVSYLKKNGFEVHAISSSGELGTQFAEQEAIPVHVVNMERRIAPIADIVSLWQLYFLLRHINPDIVHSHTPKGGLLGMIGAWLARVPIRIYHVHGLLTTATGIKKWLLWVSDRLACRLAHQVYCVSPSVRQLVIDKGLCPADKIRVLHHGSINGVASETLFNPLFHTRLHSNIRTKLTISLDMIVIGFVGRVLVDKGIIELASSWNILSNNNLNIYLLLIGPMEQQDPILDEILATWEKHPRSHLTGQIAKHQIPEFYAAMDVLVLPSYREGFPNVLLEAAAMGIPVVSTQIPGCVDSVVDGVTGTLVPARNAEALRIAIQHYIDDPALRWKHGQAGRERVLRDFCPEDIWQALLTEYERLLLEKGIDVRLEH